MKVLDFLQVLRDGDIRISADGEQLRCNGPTGALTPELRDELRQRKTEILKYLRSAESLAGQQPAIVPLQPLGNATPIFAVAGHNGDVFCFRALAQQLGANQPFFGLQPPGLDGNREPLSGVEELATWFASQIRVVQPAGPYVIVGYCAGGTIAFELARQLLRDGAEIRALALFGSPFPTFYRFGPQFRWHLTQSAERVARHTRSLARLPAIEKWNYIAQRLRNLTAERTGRSKATKDPVLVWRNKVERATLAAIRRYKLSSFAGRLSLFLPHPDYGGNALAQWPTIVRDTQSYFGPDGCSGATMLRAPYVRTLAKLFQCALQGTRNGRTIFQQESPGALRA